MDVKPIVLYPKDKSILRRKCDPVKHLNAEAKRLVQDLVDTLNDHPEGVGLAAPQISAHRRIIVVRLGGDPDTGGDLSPPMPLINPRILESRDEIKDFDGCLSLPGLYGRTVRPHYIRITSLDETGRRINRVLEGFDAVVVHHEIDHLNGVLFIDRVETIEDLYRVRKDENGNLVRVPLSPTT